MSNFLSRRPRPEAVCGHARHYSTATKDILQKRASANTPLRCPRRNGAVRCRVPLASVPKIPRPLEKAPSSREAPREGPSERPLSTALRGDPSRRPFETALRDDALRQPLEKTP